jgi:basic membrane protein A
MNAYRAALIALAVVLVGSMIAQVSLAPQDRPDRPRVWIAYASPKGDQSYVDSAWTGLDRANRTRSFSFEEFVPADRERLEARLLSGTDRPDLVIVQDSGQWPDAGSAWSLAHPDVAFLVIDGTVTLRPNVRWVRIASRGVSYLAGALAASAANGRPIAVLAAMPSTVMDEYVQGFSAGALAASPGTPVAIRYIGDTLDAYSAPDKAAEIADDLYRNGTAVIYAACGGSAVGVIDAAGRGPGRFVVGVDRDMTALGPDVILGSAVKGVDRLVEEAIADHLDGTLAPGATRIGLGENATALVLNPRFAQHGFVLERYRAAAEEWDG